MTCQVLTPLTLLIVIDNSDTLLLYLSIFFFQLARRPKHICSFFLYLYNTPSWKLKQLGAQAKHGSLIKSANGLFQIWLKLGKNPNFRQFFENNILYCCLVNCIDNIMYLYPTVLFRKAGPNTYFVLIIFVMKKKIICKNFFST